MFRAIVIGVDVLRKIREISLRVNLDGVSFRHLQLVRCFFEKRGSTFEFSLKEFGFASEKLGLRLQRFPLEMTVPLLALEFCYVSGKMLGCHGVA